MHAGGTWSFGPPWLTIGGLLIAQNTFGNLEQAAQLDEGGDAGTDRRLEVLVADPAESEQPASGWKLEVLR